MLYGAIAIGWAACGIFAYGHTLAFFQKHYNVYGLSKEDRKKDVVFSAATAIVGGPAALVTTFALHGFKYGFLWRPLEDDQINWGG